MDIIVTNGCIIYKKKNYLPGSTIRGIDEKEADRLIRLGKAMPSKAADQGKDTEATAQKPEPKKKA